MLPTAYEFHWDLGHIFFLGIFYSVLTVVFCHAGASPRCALAARPAPPPRRRHRLARVVRRPRRRPPPLPPRIRRHRRRPQGLQPRVRLRQLSASTRRWRRPAAGATSSRAGRNGSPRPGERLFHRGHTWVEPRADGTFDVGVDDLLQRCLGRPDRVTVPGVGTRVQAGAAGGRAPARPGARPRRRAADRHRGRHRRLRRRPAVPRAAAGRPPAPGTVAARRARRASGGCANSSCCRRAWAPRRCRAGAGRRRRDGRRPDGRLPGRRLGRHHRRPLPGALTGR